MMVGAPRWRASPRMRKERGVPSLTVLTPSRRGPWGAYRKIKPEMCSCQQAKSGNPALFSGALRVH
jgi:hypothetical protein